MVEPLQQSRIHQRLEASSLGRGVTTHDLRADGTGRDGLSGRHAVRTVEGNCMIGGIVVIDTFLSLALCRLGAKFSIYQPSRCLPNLTDTDESGWEKPIMGCNLC